MTKTRNFPGRKTERRVGAAERLDAQIQKLSEENPGQRAKIVQKIRELNVLKERIAKGGRKTTKKVGKNIGRS